MLCGKRVSDKKKFLLFHHNVKMLPMFASDVGLIWS